MNDLNIHADIKTKLDTFISENKTPHIIFHGDSGSGKRRLVNYFIQKLYKNDVNIIKDYVMYVNCSHGKGIKFIRNELKFFAKTNIKNKSQFKSIILINADKLTIDAQSALRRCIELFSSTTRFFIIIENIEKLLKPIRSRFCSIYLNYHEIADYTSLYEYKIKDVYNINFYTKRSEWLRKNILAEAKKKKLKSLIEFINKLYDRAYCANDIVNIVDSLKIIVGETKYLLLIYYDDICKEFRNEKTLMLLLLYFMIIRKDLTLENIKTF